MALPGWGPWEVGRRFIEKCYPDQCLQRWRKQDWAEGEFELLRSSFIRASVIPQGMLQLEWPSELGPEAQAFDAHTEQSLDAIGWHLPTSPP